MATETETNAVTYLNTKFTAALDYADSAQASLSGFLTSMANQLSDYTGVPVNITAVTFPTDAYSPASITATAPTVPTLPTAPATETLTITHADDISSSAISANFATRVNAALTTSKILSASEEQALFDRASGRMDVENEKLEADATNLWASRGFELPSGTLLAVIAQSALEQSRNRLEINSEVLAKSGELAMTAASASLQVAAQYEQAWLSHLDQINDRDVKVKAANINNVLQAYVSVAKVLVDKYMADVQRYATELSTAIEKEKLGIEAVDGATKLALAKKEEILKEAEIKIKDKQLVLQMQLESLKTSATVSAQVIASALNSVNASASYGFQGSVSDSTSSVESTDLTKGTVAKNVTEVISYDGGTGTPAPLE